LPTLALNTYDDDDDDDDDAFLAVFVYATHATQAIAFEWKPGLTLHRINPKNTHENSNLRQRLFYLANLNGQIAAPQHEIVII